MFIPYNYFIILMRKGSHSFIYYLTAQIISFYRLNCDFLMSSECVRSLENIKYIAKKDEHLSHFPFKIY